ncbi:hypothetical protein D3C76_1766880 [compost metagenome]
MIHPGAVVANFNHHFARFLTVDIQLQHSSLLHMLDPVDEGVLQNGLQGQAGNDAIQSLLVDLRYKPNPVAKPGFLNVHIFIYVLYLFS